MSKNQEKIEASTDKTVEKAAKNPAAKRQKASKPSFGERLQSFKEYLTHSRLELRKVSWPTMKETRTTSYVVLGFITVMAILLGVVDFLLSSTIRLILS